MLELRAHSRSCAAVSGVDRGFVNDADRLRVGGVLATARAASSSSTRAGRRRTREGLPPRLVRRSSKVIFDSRWLEGGGAAPVRPAGPRSDGSDGAPSAGTRSLSGEFVAKPRRGRAATVVAKRRRLRLPHVQPPPPSRWLHRHPERPQRRPALLVLQQVGSQADHPVNSSYRP